ncbi:MAG TPA: hypothetical protein VMU39_14770 [Solirubrobacteraceae bacterium]|nr:hypothetical protein [Solirubrobacteraceae bacterium]
MRSSPGSARTCIRARNFAAALGLVNPRFRRWRPLLSLYSVR